MSAADPVSISLTRAQWEDVARFIDHFPIAGVDPAGVQELCHELGVLGLFEPPRHD